MDAASYEEFEVRWRRVTGARQSDAPVSLKAAAAVDAIIEDLCDRRGLKTEYRQCDDDVKASIKATWGRIVDAVFAPPAKNATSIKYGCSLCGNLNFEMYSAHCADRTYHGFNEPFDLFVD